MSDLPEAAVATVRDPLVVTLIIFSFGGLLAHFLFRSRPLGRAMVRVMFLVALTLVLLYAGLDPLSTADPNRACRSGMRSTPC